MVFLPLSAWSLLLVLFCSAKVIYSIWLKPKSWERQLRRQGIKGNPYRLLYGDMADDNKARAVASRKPIELTHRIVHRASPFLHQLLQKYGKRSMAWVGTTPRVTVCDPETMAEVLMNRTPHQFQKPTFNPLVKLLAMGVSTLEGEAWANRRKIINPAFHMEKLKSMVPAFQKSCIDMVERWQNMISEQGSCELDVWDELQNLTGDVISRTAFGSNYKEGKKIFELQKEQVLLVLEAARIPYIPGFRFLPTSSNKRRMLIYNEIRSLLKDMINKKTAAISKGEATGDDLLGLLVQYSDDKVPGDRSITIDDVIEECKLFYFAGQETTSVLLTWTLILLSIHPEWQHRAREEVLSVCGKRSPDFESISHLKLVTMILYEVLRLYPPVTALIRRTVKTAKIGDLSLPAGVEVLLPIISIHHDREIWGEDVEEFKPERFSEGVAKASKVSNAFFPFGWGPRICLGQNFAMVEAKIALASILQQFCVELSPSYVHAPHTIITLQPQFGAQLILHQL